MALEVRVVSAAGGGLKIIDHIPPVRPCRLEGQNGIGKSALVRLLLLLSGRQPYSGEAAPWRSLKALIGPTSVTITGLTGSFASATVQLTPRLWPATPDEEIGDWLGVLTLDGLERPIGLLFDLLSVVHLSGTERLLDTLNQQSGRLAVALGDVRACLDALDTQRAELGELAEALEFVSPAAAAAERARWEQVSSDRRELEGRLAQTRPRSEDLSRASALSALVERGDAAEHQRKLQDLRTDLEAARLRLRAAESNHDGAISALAEGSKAQRELAKIERRLGAIGRARAALAARQEELGSLLESLSIPADAVAFDEVERAALDSAFAPALDQQRRLLIHQARQHRSDSENRLLDDLRIVLEDALDSGLAATVVARIRNIDITVSNLLEGLGFADGAVEVEVPEMAEVSHKLAQLTELRELFEQRATLTKEDAELQKILALHETDAASHDELRKNAIDARAALDSAGSQVRAHTMEIGSLSRSVLGGADGEDVEGLIRDLLAKHDTAPEVLDTASAEASAEMMELQSRDESLRKEEDGLAASEARRRVQREQLRRHSESDPLRRWLAELASVVTHESQDLTQGADWPDDTWQRVADHVATSRSALAALVRDVSGLETLAPQLPSQSNRQTNRLASAIKAVVEQDAVAELSSKPIADALFDGGTVLRVDLDEGSITWRTLDGHTRTRPLTAFSSGEQALGFMRARLQQIADEPADNRLVFLDEFGAFISADRRRPLADLLTSRELRALSEQVVVVLPLQSDYAAELEETTGALHKQYEERARAVEVHGYFAEEFAG